MGLLTVFCLLILHNIIFVQSYVPTLSVQKLDGNLIKRKREDTREMCRRFNAKVAQINGNNVNYFRTGRWKRSISFPEEKVKYGNPMLSEKDAQMVENLVDKLYYDEVDEDGKQIPFRKKKIETTTEKVVYNISKSGRRFDFAPAELLGPQAKLKGREENVTGFHVPWPKRWYHGIVPYFIDPKSYDNQLVDVIMSAFDYFERATCIRLQRLRERPRDKKSLRKVEWVYITNPSGIRQCVHSNEKKVNKGVQIVVFGYDCMSLGQIVHEVMHVLGFSHEHTRPDRDAYISVLWDNIKPGYKKYFEARKEDSLLVLPYDYSSVLHYPPRAFSKNGQITILTEAGLKLGQRHGLSETDLEKIGMIFGQDCIDRNRAYLLKTCPAVAESKKKTMKPITAKEVEDYFNGRIWPYGIVNYKLRDRIEFTSEEKANINAVIRHIEKETCIEFRDVGEDDDDDENDGAKGADGAKDGFNKNQSNILHPQGIGKWAKILMHENDTGINESENEVNSIETLKVASFKPEKFTVPIVFTVSNNARRSANKTTTKAPSKSTKSNKITKNIKKKDGKVRSKRSMPQSPSRRHANSILIFTRSPKPGCECPKPGLTDGNQIIKLSSDCFNSVNDLLHVFGHVLGLDHQHNMHDRDDFLHIQWNDLTDELKEDMKTKLPVAASAGFPYDYQSVMHYPWLQIKNGVANIMYPVWNDGWAMGHWQGLSSTDQQKLNMLYYKQCMERRKHAAEDNKL